MPANPTQILLADDNERDVFLSIGACLGYGIAGPANADGFLKLIQAIENFWVTFVQRSKKTHQ